MAAEPHDTDTTQPSLRERRREETAFLVLDAVEAILAERGVDGLTVDRVAEHVGVSPRTVYRYFPDRAALLAAAMRRNEERSPYQPPTTPEQIGAAFAAVFPFFDEQPALFRAIHTARIAGTLRSDVRVRRVGEIEAALAPAVDRLPRREADQAGAVIAYLANALAWLSLRDESGLDGRDAGAAIAWAIDTLVADLRRRNDTIAG